MPKITVHADCENSPRKALLRDLNIAFAKADIGGILDLFTDDIRWRIMGGSVAFCDVCEFESASGDRIRSMKSYTVELKAKSS